jgi:hypothetical protein
MKCHLSEEQNIQGEKSQMALKPYNMREKRDSETLRLLEDLHTVVKECESETCEGLENKKALFDGLKVLIEDAEKKLEGFAPMPFGWRWHVNIIPNVQYEIITREREKWRGSFQNVERWACFVVGNLNRAEKLIKFNEITYYRRIA